MESVPAVYVDGGVFGGGDILKADFAAVGSWAGA
jgi:glutaredoxin-related protein